MRDFTQLPRARTDEEGNVPDFWPPRGQSAETFVDNVTREHFDNYQEFVELYPDAPPMKELDLPRVCFARQLPRAIARVLEAIADEVVGRRSDAA